MDLHKIELDFFNKRIFPYISVVTKSAKAGYIWEIKRLSEMLDSDENTILLQKERINMLKIKYEAYKHIYNSFKRIKEELENKQLL